MSFDTYTNSDGFLVEKHPTSIDNGKTPVGTVDVVCYPTIAELIEYQDEKQALADEKAGRTIRLQRELRQSKKTGKMPAADYKRLYNALTNAEMQIISASSDRTTVQNGMILEKWKAEQENAA